MRSNYSLVFSTSRPTPYLAQYEGAMKPAPPQDELDPSWSPRSTSTRPPSSAGAGVADDVVTWGRRRGSTWIEHCAGDHQESFRGVDGRHQDGGQESPSDLR